MGQMRARELVSYYPRGWLEAGPESREILSICAQLAAHLFFLLARSPIVLIDFCAKLALPAVCVSTFMQFVRRCWLIWLK